MITIVLGVLLTALGVGSYFGTDQVSKTALIPAYFGIVTLILGAISWAKPSWRMHAMHGAVLLALVGAAGTVAGLVKLIGGDLAGHARSAAMAKSAMFGLCTFYVVLCVRSFIGARRARRQSTGEPVRR